MKGKNEKQKNYKEHLLWAIIIIFILFIVCLDVIYFVKKQQTSEIDKQSVSAKKEESCTVNL